MPTVVNHPALYHPEHLQLTEIWTIKIEAMVEHLGKNLVEDRSSVEFSDAYGVALR